MTNGLLLGVLAADVVGIKGWVAIGIFLLVWSAVWLVEFVTAR